MLALFSYFFLPYFNTFSIKVLLLLDIFAVWFSATVGLGFTSRAILGKSIYLNFEKNLEFKMVVV